MNLHHVDSKQTMLSPEDILMVAAHDHKDAAQKYYEQVGSPEGVSPERVLYTVWIDQMKNPNVVRMRQGNTLFNIVPGKEKVGLILMFDADVPRMTIRNMGEAMRAARKMGFAKLMFGAKVPAIMKMVEMAFNLAREPDAKFIKYKNSAAVEFKNVR